MMADVTIKDGLAEPNVDIPEEWRDYARHLDAARVLWGEVIPGGGHASWLLARGTALEFVALAAGANCSVVAYAAPQYLERYNMPDSLKAQHTAHLTAGHVLMTDMGRAIASVTADSLGWHDPLGLVLDAPTMERKYGAHRYERFRNDMHRSGRDGLLIELGKHGLGARDLIAPVNLFSKVTVDAEGRFHFAAGHGGAGDRVTLRLDMDALVAVSSAPHPLDPRPAYAPAAIGIAAWRAGPAALDDPCRTFCPENARAHHNTDVYVAR